MIKIHNDGKGKIFSYEATLDVDSFYYTTMAESEEEAIDQLKQHVNSMIEQLKNIDYNKRRYVDCFGNSLKNDKTT